MGGKKSKQKNSTSSKIITTDITASSDIMNPKQRIVQNFVLVWMDANINPLNKDCQNTLTQLRSVVNDVNVFTQQDKCIDFLKTINVEKIFVIISGSLGQHLIPDIHDLQQVDTIYIFCGNKSRHEQWTKTWTKIKGLHTEIKSICEALRLAAKRCNEDSVAISFVSANKGICNGNLNQLEPSFMYTQIFKEILLEMQHSNQSIKDLAVYCRKLYEGNVNELDIINEFEYNYRPELSIWWYTRECFIYQMLNRALRTLEGDTIINMGFFIHDLHCQLKQFHQKQVSSYNGKTFVVYRGQGLSTKDFEKLRKTRGGLISFNNFLSTSTKQQVSLDFARDALTRTNTIGILFEMSIDPSISSAPFASIQEASYFHAEEEILFSMHTIFRINEITQINNENSLYQVELKLTSDDDEQLHKLTERIRREASDGTGWQRIGNLLLTIGQFTKAEELYRSLLEQTSNESEKAIYYNQLGYIKDDQGDYEKAISFYEKALEIDQKALSQNRPSLATTYNNIAGVYYHMKEYSKALLFYEKAFEIYQKSPSTDHLLLATSYNNIGLVHNSIAEYSKALWSHEIALRIRQKILPQNHPDLATSYNNIGEVYRNMEEYSKALSFYEKALAIFEKTLPSNHPSLATSYNNIGLMFRNMGNYSKALSFYERALDIKQHSLPPNHPTIQSVRNSIDFVKQKL